MCMIRIVQTHISVMEQTDFERDRNLWDLEAIAINQEKEILRSEADAIDKFERNTRFKNGRYEIKLLWKEGCNTLNSKYEVAESCLISLNNKFRHDPHLYFRYKEIINEQLRDGIIEQVTFHGDCDRKIDYFYAYHTEVRESKESTKVRIVYDVSSKVRNGQSLNDCLDSGPNLNPDLLRIILRFRYHSIAFCADIQRAFSEIGIVEENRKFL
ncbi:uncharacterized protein LOC118188378 [Stegodyphus dumicola]|uniref:uncharacterized protein LOC118188378 n=1 Tax=Stegodyphus dumicola TaxID=202533 RepID=UPI0015B10A68|nr:uncharacterized protein LOC118188378 [Stegodyphus dumicola]